MTSLLYLFPKPPLFQNPPNFTATSGTPFNTPLNFQLFHHFTCFTRKCNILYLSVVGVGSPSGLSLYTSVVVILFPLLSHWLYGYVLALFSLLLGLARSALHMKSCYWLIFPLKKKRKKVEMWSEHLRGFEWIFCHLVSIFIIAPSRTENLHPSIHPSIHGKFRVRC